MLVIPDGGGAVPLGQLLPIGPEDHGDVGEHRDVRAERAVERDLLRRIGDVVVAPDHMGDAHGDIVGDDGHVVDGRPVAPENDEVVQVPAVPGDEAVHRVFPGDVFLGHPEPDGKGHARFDPAADLVLPEAATASVVLESLAAGRR